MKIPARAITFVVYNILVLIGIGIAIRHGLLIKTYHTDSTGIGFGIMGLFVVTHLALWYGLLLARVPRDMGFVYTSANLQVFFGLFGTMVGAFIALSGLDTTVIGTKDAGGNIGVFVEGMGIAFWTSIIGMAGCAITYVNYKLLGGRHE